MDSSADPPAETNQTSAPAPAPALQAVHVETKAPDTTSANAPDSGPGMQPHIDEGKLSNSEKNGTTARPRESIDTDSTDINPPDFQGDVETNNDLPSIQTLRKIGSYVVLDRNGKTHTFKSLYTPRNGARRVLIIFVRHFFCGNCQDYLRSLSTSITSEALLQLPISTSIAVIGCGDPGLIDMYAAATGCPFSVYADPTRKLYQELGMISTLALGSRPQYMSRSLLRSSLDSVFQGLKQIRTGLVLKMGNSKQVGGEFLFEPESLLTPIGEPDRRIGDIIPGSPEGNASADRHALPASNQHVGDDDEETGPVEEKRVTWCHRMRNTRDHAEIPELMDVLGLEREAQHGDEKTDRPTVQTKGTGLSMASQMNQMKMDGSAAKVADARTVPAKY